MREIGWTGILLWAGAVGAAINGGVFFAFSFLTMPALDRLAATDPRGAVVAMQAVNDVAVRPPLMILLFGTTAIALGVGALGLFRVPGLAGWLATAGAAVFLLGITVLTVADNVPLNDTLAAVDPARDAAAAWAAYSPGWTAANHVRTAGGIVGAALLATAARIV